MANTKLTSLSSKRESESSVTGRAEGVKRMLDTTISNWLLDDESETVENKEIVEEMNL